MIALAREHLAAFEQGRVGAAGFAAPGVSAAGAVARLSRQDGRRSSPLDGVARLSALRRHWLLLRRATQGLAGHFDVNVNHAKDLAEPKLLPKTTGRPEEIPIHEPACAGRDRRRRHCAVGRGRAFHRRQQDGDARRRGSGAEPFRGGFSRRSGGSGPPDGGRQDGIPRSRARAHRHRPQRRRLLFDPHRHGSATSWLWTPTTANTISLRLADFTWKGGRFAFADATDAQGCR